MLHVMNPSSLTSWKLKKGEIQQPMPHEIKPMSLTHWMVKKEGKLSAHAACNESDVTYSLEGKGGAQFVSACHMP